MELKTHIRRPQDCSKDIIERFVEIVLSGSEMNEKMVRGSIPYAEVILLTAKDGQLVGVSALKFPRQSYLKHLYQEAGVPEMYNPFSIEACWLSVLPQHRGQGVWQNNQSARVEYLTNRPYHSVRRVNNPNIKALSKDPHYEQAGEDFYSDILSETVRLMVANHDKEFNSKKRFLYLEPDAKYGTT